jgi:hypothetical protein
MPCPPALIIEKLYARKEMSKSPNAEHSAKLIYEGEIRFGLSALKGLGKGPVSLDECSHGHFVRSIWRWMNG